MPLPYISVDNFRVFKEKTEFEFAPITILTGTNSSGKSSLVDALRILQNYTDDFVDPEKDKFWDKIINLKDSHLHSRIPDFKDLVNYYTDKKSIVFEFKCNFIGMDDIVTLCLEFKQKDDKGINGALTSLQIKNEEGYAFFSVNFMDDRIIRLEIDYEFFYKKFNEKIKNEIDYFDSSSVAYSYDEVEDSVVEYRNPEMSYVQYVNPVSIFKGFGILYTQYEKIKKDFKNEAQLYYKHGIEYTKKEKNLLNETLTKKFSIDLDQTTDNGGMDDVIGWFFNDPIFTILFANKDNFPFKFYDADTQGFLKRYFGPEHLGTDGELLFAITDLGHFFYDRFVYENIRNSLFGLKDNFKFNYISSIRNSPDRYYKKNGKETSFGNLLSDFLEKKPQANEKVKKFLNKYLSYFNIGDEVEIERDGHALYTIDVYKQGIDRKINLIDLGYGISQIMPILLQILLTAFDGKVNAIIIEEPETNLHPALQSKLADMIIDANEEFGIQFIIETHSEYLIRRLQGLVATNIISADKINMYYFNHPDNIPEGEPQVYQITIEEDGALSKNFGKGFYDEAATLNIALYNYSKEQHN